MMHVGYSLAHGRSQRQETLRKELSEGIYKTDTLYSVGPTQSVHQSVPLNSMFSPVLIVLIVSEVESKYLFDIFKGKHRLEISGSTKNAVGPQSVHQSVPTNSMFSRVLNAFIVSQVE